MNKLSQGAIQILEWLQENGKGTIADMKKTGLPKANPSHLRALNERGLVESEQTTLKCECCGHSRKVLEHTITELGMAYKGE